MSDLIAAAATSAPPLRGSLTPSFEPEVVDRDLADGYWIQAVDITGNGRPDLVTSGLAVGDVFWYENPGWRKRPVATFPKPVALDAADIDGDGRNDLVISHDYGDCMFNCKPEDGRISWLRNPGTYAADRTWEVRHIADRMATHRLRLGHFSRTDRLELMALPVVGETGVHEPVAITLYQVPDDPLTATSWDGEVIDGDTYRIVHCVAPGTYGARDGSPLESVVLSSEEGVSWFRWADGRWRTDVLGTGEQTQFAATGFRGSGNAAVGRLGDDPYAYIATVEPFHGNTVAVYHKDNRARLTGATWTRTVLDVYGDPNDSGEGPGHHVVCADFDGDGNDEFLIALRGPMPWQGVFYYKAIDAANGLWTKTRVATASAARITVADFDGDGRLDFATTGYYTPGYFLCDDPRNVVYHNRFAPTP